MSGLRYLEGVVSLALDEGACTGCGECLLVCPRGVLTVAGRKAVLSDRDACIECGACALNCPVGAISVKPGVGCAQAIIKGWITRSEPNCDCG